MAPPFWKGSGDAGIFWVFRPALIEDSRFGDSKAFSQPRHCSAGGLRPGGHAYLTHGPRQGSKFILPIRKKLAVLPQMAKAIC
jgi:hypothetical protein